MRRSKLLSALALLTLLGSSACAKETVVHQQDERNANKIIALLEKLGVKSEKHKDEGSRELRFNIMVAKDDAPRSLELLEQYNLPETLKDSTCSVFKDGGMIPTAQQERAKRECAIAGDLVNSFRRVARIIDASAVVSIPEDNPLRDPSEAKPRPKVAVILSFLPDGTDAPPMTAEEVARYAAAAVPDTTSKDVSVQMIPFGKQNMNGGGAGAEPGAAPPIPLNGCEKQSVIGIDVCVQHKQRLLNALVGAALFAAVLATMAVFAVLRALRYRKDLTRLTAQVAQLRK